MINFDNAATSGKKPERVIQAVNYALYNLSANPGRGGHDLSVKTANAVYNARVKIADYFGASGASNVIFTANCTTSVNFVLKGFLKSGDHIVVSDLEHNAVMRPIKKTGIDYSVAKVSLADDDVTVKNFEKLINDNTKMIFCTAASNVCGKTVPLEKIGKLCRQRGIAFGVDAAQMAGVLPIDMKKMNIDFLCIAAHKGLNAPMGLGILIAERDIGDTVVEGGTGTNSLSLYQPEFMPERYESGTINVPAIVGTGAGIDFLRSNARGSYNSEMQKIQRLYTSLATMPNIEIYTPYMQEFLYVPVLSFNVKGINSEKTASYLNSKGIAVRAGLHCAPAAHYKLKTNEQGTVRVSLSYYNTPSEIEYLIKVIKNNDLIKKNID